MTYKTTQPCTHNHIVIFNLNNSRSILKIASPQPTFFHHIKILWITNISKPYARAIHPPPPPQAPWQNCHIFSTLRHHSLKSLVRPPPPARVYQHIIEIFDSPSSRINFMSMHASDTSSLLCMDVFVAAYASSSGMIGSAVSATPSAMALICSLVAKRPWMRGRRSALCLRAW